MLHKLQTCSMFDMGTVYKAAYQNFNVFRMLILLLAEAQSGSREVQVTLSLIVKAITNQMNEWWSKPEENREIRKLLEYLLLEPLNKTKPTETHDSRKEHIIFTLVSLGSCAVPPTIYFWTLSCNYGICLPTALQVQLKKALQKNPSWQSHQRKGSFQSFWKGHS